MNKLILFAFLSFLSFSAYAQVTFDKGYLINNEGKRVDVLIRNSDKLSNLNQFVYKLSENGETHLGTIDSVQEFEIFNTVHKYQRTTVNIDRSSENLRDISDSREPLFKQETLFLKVLVEGKASLYAYQEQNGFGRFFYKVDSTSIEQLVYKKYMVDGTKFSENNAYRQQLYTSIKCQDFTPEQFNKLDYHQKELAKLFVKYNECAGASYTNFSQRRQKKEFLLSYKVKAGANYTSLRMEQRVTDFYTSLQKEQGVNLSYQGPSYSYVTELGPEVLPQLGFEAELVLPFNKNQWSLFTEPSFQYYKKTYETKAFNRDAILKVNYSHFMLPLGARRYFYLKSGSALFLNVAFSLNYLPNAPNAIEINKINTNIGFDHKSFNSSWVAGAGYTYKNKYSVEARYQSNKNMIDGRYLRNTLINPFAVVLGYKLY